MPFTGFLQVCEQWKTATIFLKDEEYNCYSYNINFPNKVLKILVTDVSNDEGINNNNITCFAVRQATITNNGFKVNSKTLLNNAGSNYDALNLIAIGI